MKRLLVLALAVGAIAVPSAQATTYAGGYSYTASGAPCWNCLNIALRNNAFYKSVTGFDWTMVIQAPGISFPAHSDLYTFYARQATGTAGCYLFSDTKSISVGWWQSNTFFNLGSFYANHRACPTSIEVDPVLGAVLQQP